MGDKYYSMYLGVMKDKKSFTDAAGHCNLWTGASIASPMVSYSILS